MEPTGRAPGTAAAACVASSARTVAPGWSGAVSFSQGRLDLEQRGMLQGGWLWPVLALLVAAPTWGEHVGLGRLSPCVPALLRGMVLERTRLRPGVAPGRGPWPDTQSPPLSRPLIRFSRCRCTGKCYTQAKKHGVHHDGSGTRQRRGPRGPWLPLFQLQLCHRTHPREAVHPDELQMLAAAVSGRDGFIC